MRTSDLKILAVISMLVDHIGYVWGCFGAPLSRTLPLRMFGRISFPLFCLCLAVGCRKTHDRPAYFTRLMICAALSQVPYSMVFDSYAVPWAGIAYPRAIEASCEWPLLCVGLFCAIPIIMHFRQSDHMRAAIPAALAVCILLALRLRLPCILWGGTRTSG